LIISARSAEFLITGAFKIIKNRLLSCTAAVTVHDARHYKENRFILSDFNSGIRVVNTQLPKI